MERMVQDCATRFDNNAFHLCGNSFGPCIFQLSSFILKFFSRKFHSDFGLSGSLFVKSCLLNSTLVCGLLFYCLIWAYKIFIWFYSFILTVIWKSLQRKFLKHEDQKFQNYKCRNAKDCIKIMHGRLFSAISSPKVFWVIF